MTDPSTKERKGKPAPYTHAAKALLLLLQSIGRAPLEALPLFATDDLLGAALLGRDRVEEWKQLVPLLEARGLPKIDPMMGGRFVPAVRRFFEHQYGLGTSTPLAPDGAEDLDAWKRAGPNRHS